MKKTYFLFVVIFAFIHINAQVCTPLYTSGCTFSDYIDRFTLVGSAGSNINQIATGCGTNGYQNFMSTVPVLNMVRGNVFSGTITEGFASNNVRIWIDFNKNDTFEASEQVGTVSNISTTATAPTAFTITIPPAAATGLTKMRVRGAWNTVATTIDPCTNYSFGETHDYMVNIFPILPCSGTPNIASMDGTTSFCPTVASSFSVAIDTPFSGFTYQWQTSTNGVTWTNSATTAGYSSTFAATTYVRAILTCAYSGLKDTSGVIKDSLKPFYNCYCASKATSTADTKIDRMQFLTTDQPSVSTTCEDYTDYTYLPIPKVKAGSSFDITLTNGSCSGAHYAAYGAFYLDSSMNGVFEATERVGATFGASTALNQAFTRTFNVPITARRGVTGLRALWYETSAPSSGCYSSTFGETEDYLVEIFKDSIDLAVVKIDSPISGCSLTSVPVKFKVNNMGINAVTNPTFFYNVDGGAAISETFTVVVNPMVTNQVFTFTIPASVSPIGNHTIKVWFSNIKDTAKSNDTSKISIINYLTPNKPTIKNDTACVLSKSATLSAVSAPGIITSWYYPTYGKKVGEGPTFTINNPVANSAYIVRSILALSNFVGLRDTAPGAYMTDSSGRGLVFNVLDSAMFRLNTVDIYSDLTNLSIGIWIKNSAGVNILPKITYVILNRGVNTVPINVDLPAGTGYKIVLDTGSGAKLYTTTSIAYATNPSLSIPNVVKITGSTHAAATYYYFYNWNVTYSGCISPLDTVRLVMAADTTPIRVLKDSVACFYPGVVLDAQNTNQNGVKYKWSTGATTRTISTNVSGQYTVKISNIAGCNVTDTANISIKASPIFSLGNDTSFCSNSSLLLRTGFNNIGYNHRWKNLSDTLSISDANKFNTFLNPPKSGTYVCNVLNTLTNCGYSDTVNITQYPAPYVFLGYDTTICVGGTYKLKGPISSNYSYLWFNNSTANNTTVTGPGKYWLKVTDMSNAIQCSTSDTIIVSYSSLTKPNLGLDSISSCKSSELIGVTPSSAYTYFWSTGDNTSQITVNQNGTYILNVNELGTLCTFSDTIKVKFLSNPTLELGSDITKCASSYKITANSGFTSYQWSTGFTVPSITVTASGTYTVTASSACATITDQVNVSLQQPPVVTLPNDTIVCSPITVSIPTQPTGNTIKWSTNETGTSKTIDQTGIYWVSVTNLCGTYSDAISVNMDSTPIPKFGVQQFASFISLRDSSKFGRTYKWYFGDGDSSSLVNPSHLYQTPGTYTITLVVTNKCGTSQSISKSVTISNSNVNSITPEDFYAYPNPASTDIVVKISNIDHHVKNIKLINMEGKELKMILVENKEPLIEQKIDLSEVPSGVYYISVEKNNIASLIKKIVVIK